MVDIMGKEVLARIFRERDWSEDGGQIVAMERTISRNWGWIETRWIVLRDGERTELGFSHRLYSAVEISSLLTGCGFSEVEVYGDYLGSAYDQTAKRLVTGARK